MHNFLFLNRINNETKLLSRAYISTTYLMYIFPCHNACNNNRLSKVIIYTATISTPLVRLAFGKVENGNTATEKVWECPLWIFAEGDWQHCPPPLSPVPCLSFLLSPLLFFSLFSIFSLFLFHCSFFFICLFVFIIFFHFLFNKRQIFSYLRIEV